MNPELSLPFADASIAHAYLFQAIQPPAGEVKALLGDKVVGAAVKEGLGRYSAKHMPAVDACALIEGSVYAALVARNWPDPLKFAPPVTFSVELATPDRAVDMAGKPGVEVVDSRHIRSTADSFWKAWDQFWYR